MLEKISFRVVRASSEEAGYLSCDLERQGPTINGWRSVKASSSNFTPFPQEIIIQLEARAKLGHMQLLAHQYLIPEKIEIFIGEYLESFADSQAEFPGKIDIEKIQFIQLGHVSMSTNQSTGFKARELKSISLECNGGFLKFLFHTSYKNKYNRQQQVALVAINLFGEKICDEVDEDMTRSNIISFEETSLSERDKNLFSPYDDISFTMYVDVEMQEIIRKMDFKKMEAILDERFDYASKLKRTMEHLRKSGELLAKYQLEKQIAASREDFERAKEKKTQMDTYRASLFKSYRIKELLEPNGRLMENDEPGQAIGLMAGMSRSVTELSLVPPTISAASTPESTTSERFSSTSRLTTPENEKKESGYYSNDEPRFPPLLVKKRRPPSAVIIQSTHSVHTVPHVEKEPKEKEEKICPKPSNLSERARRYAALPISVFGEQLVEKIFSRNFAVKEDGLKYLHKSLSDYKKGDKNNPPSKIFRAATLLLQRTIKDTIFSVFNFTIITLVYLLDDFSRKHRLPGSELSQGLERMLPELLSKSGDTALGKNKVATECILKLQSCQHIRSLHVISTHLTKPFDTPVLPRLAQSKTEMVEELLLKYGLSSEKNSGMCARDVVEFAVSGLHQPTESVRRVAERLVVNLYHTHPKLVRQHLPLEEDISPKNIQFRQLFQQFDKIEKERKDGASLSVILKDAGGKGNNTSMTSSVYIPKM